MCWLDEDHPRPHGHYCPFNILGLPLTPEAPLKGSMLLCTAYQSFMLMDALSKEILILQKAILEGKDHALVPYCSIIHNPKRSSLKEKTCIMLQFLRVRKAKGKQSLSQSCNESVIQGQSHRKVQHMRKQSSPKWLLAGIRSPLAVGQRHQFLSSGSIH